MSRTIYCYLKYFCIKTFVYCIFDDWFRDQASNLLDGSQKITDMNTLYLTDFSCKIALSICFSLLHLLNCLDYAYLTLQTGNVHQMINAPKNKVWLIIILGIKVTKCNFVKWQGFVCKRLIQRKTFVQFVFVICYILIFNNKIAYSKKCIPARSLKNYCKKKKNTLEFEASLNLNKYIYYFFIT